MNVVYGQGHVLIVVSLSELIQEILFLVVLISLQFNKIRYQVQVVPVTP